MAQTTRTLARICILGVWLTLLPILGVKSPENPNFLWFKIAFLGKWDEVENVYSSGHSPVSQIATHSPCILSNTVSPPALNCSVGTSLGPVALRMARATSERSGGGKCNCSQFLSLPHFPFSSQYKSYPPVCDLCSCSQIFASC